jgi:hypothetical protein
MSDLSKKSWLERMGLKPSKAMKTSELRKLFADLEAVIEPSLSQTEASLRNSTSSS